MKTLYLDCFAGISGDMTVGALIDAGLAVQELERELARLHLSGYRLEVSRVDKRGVQATQFRVILTDGGHEHLADAEFVEEHDHGHGHGHGHTDEHDHDHTNTPQNEHIHPLAPSPLLPGSPAPQNPQRSLTDILAIIDGSDLGADVKDLAKGIFVRLGEAEARVHGIPLADVHFHEVGGVDAIVDIAGAAIAVRALGIERVVASPLHLGSGTVRMSHGLYPIPAPATAQLVQGVPVYTTEARGELVTPTGAAIVTTLAHSFGPMPLMQVERVGYGAGTRERDFPNVLRAFVGESVQTAQIAPGPALATPVSPGASGTTPAESQEMRAPRDPYPEQHTGPLTAGGYHEGRAVVVEANIDDMSPQLYEALVERLLEAGALDVVLLPAQMKKSRPGVLVQVLCQPGAVDDLLPILFSESTTIGVRTYEVARHMLQRDVRAVQTRYGTVRVKVARLGGRVVNVAPEYEDCRALARQVNAPVKLIYAAALGAASAQDW